MTHKWLYILMGCTLFILGCSKENNSPEEGNVMLEFNTSTEDDKPTDLTEEASVSKAIGGTKVTSTTLKTLNNKFKVFSTYSILGGTTTQTFKTQPLEVRYENTATGLKWTYDEKAKWFASANYKFRAIWPAEFKILDNSNENLIITEYNITQHNTDLLVAYATRHPAVDPEHYDAVEMNFKHALSALCFKIKYGDDVDPSITDELTDAYLQNLCVVGLMTYGGSSPDQISWSHSLSDSEQRYHWSKKTGDPVKSFGVGESKAVTVYDGDGIIFVIPQNIGTQSTAFHFKTTLGKTHDFFTYLPQGAWEPGKLYTYVITLYSSSLEVAVSIKDWKDIKSNVDIRL